MFTGPGQSALLPLTRRCLLSSVDPAKEPAMHHFPTVGRLACHAGLRDHLAGSVSIRRRALLSGSLALAGVTLAGTRGHALTLESMRLPYKVGPGRDGVLSWRVLDAVGPVGDQGVMFAPEVEALDGAEVRLEGFMMPFDEAPLQRQFLLAAFAAHCPFCIPGGIPSLVAVLAREPVPLTPSRLTVQGRLKLRHDVASYGLLYQLLDAALAA
jgi:hypothetical protein